MKSKVRTLMFLSMVAIFVLSACGQAATPTEAVVSPTEPGRARVLGSTLASSPRTSR